MVFGNHTYIFSCILRLRTFVWNSAITATGYSSGMLRCTRLNHWMYPCRSSPSFYGITCKSLGNTGPFRPPVNAPTNSLHRSDHEKMEFSGKFISQALTSGLSTNGKVGQDLFIPSPGSLHDDCVNAQEFCRVQLAVMLLWYFGLERAERRPTDLP